MVICFFLGGREHCYYIPVVEIPVPVPTPGPGPVNYPYLVYDATILASAQALVAKITESSVQSALQNGIGAAVQALKTRGGEHVSKITLK